MPIADLQYTPGPAGMAYAFMTEGEEDQIFSKGSNDTPWQQSFETYLPHKFGNISYDFINAGLGKNMHTTFLKSIDYIWKTFLGMHLPGISPRTENGVNDCSYTNAVAFHVIKDICIKISTQTLFTMEGLVMFLLCDLLGLLEKYSELVGYCKSKQQLINQSKSAHFRAAPFFGMPFHGDTSQAFNAGSITYFSIYCYVNTRNVSEIFINYSETGEGLTSIPRLLSNEIMDKDSVEFGLWSNNVWCSKKERNNLLDEYHETVFTEYKIAGEHDVAAQPTGGKFEFNIDMKGPVTFVGLFIQDNENLNNKNWTSGAKADGSELLKQFTVYTGSVAREDGLPAIMQRAKNIDLFGGKPTGALYVMPMCTDGNSVSSGHQTMTNAERLRVMGVLNAHNGCHVTCFYGSKNAWWTEIGKSFFIIFLKLFFINRFNKLGNGGIYKNIIIDIKFMLTFYKNRSNLAISSLPSGAHKLGKNYCYYYGKLKKENILKDNLNKKVILKTRKFFAEIIF